MTDESSHALLTQLQAGHGPAAELAAREIFDRYVARLLELVRRRVSTKLARRFDPEDVVQSAYRSFFAHARDGEYVLQRSGDLWRLLVAVTLHKLHGQIEFHSAQRRDFRREEPAPDSGDSGGFATLATAREPTPDEEAAVLEQVEHVLQHCRPEERGVLELYLQGRDIAEIADEIDRSPRTVRRALETVRLALERQLGGSTPSFVRSSVAELVVVETTGAVNSDVFDPRAPLAYADFLLEKHLGAGGMGKVYRARQLSLQRTVAVKTLRKSRQSDRAAVERFLQEGQMLARLRHPHIVGVHGLGRFPGGGYFLAMEWIAGHSLAERIADGVLPFAEAARIALAVAEAIAAAHAQGIVHCDLKPANILLDETDGVFVTDFGLAQFCEPQTRATASFGGTLAYLAPEQLELPPSPAVDVYGIGGVLYAMLTGRSPATGRVEEILAWLRTNQPVPPPSDLRPDTPPALHAICQACLEKDAQRRPPSAASVAAELRKSLP